MTQTIFGLILLFSPFLLIFKYPNKILGFAKILFYIIVLQLFIALITQAFKIFTYPVIIIINEVVLLIVLYKIIVKKIYLNLRFNLKKIDLALIFIITIAFINLYAVHYNYSGEFMTATSSEYQQIKNMVYPYPYFSDEWYSVAFIKDSLTFHSLPIKNPLDYNRGDFPNFEAAFHSFLAEIMLLLNLQPLVHYTIITIFTGIIICLLIYLFLRFNNIDKLPAAVVSLATLYITNGSNLPGLWTLIPLIMGIISFLLGFFFITAGDKKHILLVTPVILLFYPPLFPFYTLAVIIFFIKANKLSLPVKIKPIFYYFILSLFVAIVLSLVIWLNVSNLKNLFLAIFQKIFYPSFTTAGRARYLIWNIIPWPILVFSLIGIFSIFKKKIWLASTLLLGLIYWGIYFFVDYRLIIEYQRVIVFSAIIMTILAGFGLNYLIILVKEKFNFFKKINVLNHLIIVILILFLINTQNYTKRDNWKKLTLFDPSIDKILIPAAPANQYLQPDDAKIFDKIKESTFLSLPWKGTVIGVATEAHPVSTKPGTVGIYSKYNNLYYDFVKADCEQKKQIIKDYQFMFFYTPPFDCPDFQLKDTSSEGLYLYYYFYIK